MLAKLKLPLMIGVYSWMFCASLTAHAQDEAQPAAAPVAVVEAQAVATGNETIVLELFSSQACVFCPKADQLFSDLTKLDNVIGFACHVDYFDVRAGSLARPFCTTRQNQYMQALGAGPNYTPQMIINGAAEVVGYKLDDIRAVIKMTQEQHVIEPIKIENGKAGDFNLTWPSMKASEKPATLWLLLIDAPHDLEIAEGRNKGQHVNYVNIASSIENLGPWTAQSIGRSIGPDLTQHAGFIVLIQEDNGGKILAAGKHLALLPLPPGEGRGEGELP